MPLWSVPLLVDLAGGVLSRLSLAEPLNARRQLETGRLHNPDYRAAVPSELVDCGGTDTQRPGQAFSVEEGRHRRWPVRKRVASYLGYKLPQLAYRQRDGQSLVVRNLPLATAIDHETPPWVIKV
ncbi:MAG: hypothetical protein ABI895_34685 [Deltaproteobacteria bacterium]